VVPEAEAAPVAVALVVAAAEASVGAVVVDAAEAVASAVAEASAVASADSAVRTPTRGMDDSRITVRTVSSTQHNVYSPELRS
jgi:hypothetical protein